MDPSCLIITQGGTNMKRKNLFTILTAILVFTLALTACGNEKTPEDTTAATVAAPTAAPAETTAPAPAQPLALTSWTMSASTWSSPNGATIHITATPNGYEDGQKADFIVRLESDDVFSTPCQWDGTNYTASADLNAANGYCYYVALTAADGTVTEVAVNTPAAPTNNSFIDMEAALEAYCNVIVEESSFENNQLKLSNGNIQVKTPTITNDGEAITCQEAVLLLTLNGEELSRKALTLPQADETGLLEMPLETILFDIPGMEANQKVELSLQATLTNGQTLSAFGGNWSFNEEGLLPAFG